MIPAQVSGSRSKVNAQKKKEEDCDQNQPLSFLGQVFEKRGFSAIGKKKTWFPFLDRKKKAETPDLNRGPSDLKSHVAQLSWTAFGMFLEWKFGLEQV